MQSVNVSGLKNNPSEALRHAKDDLVLVMNRDKPDAVMVGFNHLVNIDKKGVNLALATSLYKNESISLRRGAAMAELTIVEFINHLSRLGIAIINQTAKEIEQDMDTLEQWLEK